MKLEVNRRKKIVEVKDVNEIETQLSSVQSLSHVRLFATP